MIFRRDLAEKVMAGEKTVTRRAVSDNPRSPWYVGGCGYRIDQVFTVNPGRGVANIGRAAVVAISLEHLGNLTDREARREGFASGAAFREAFEAINGAYDPMLLVWRIEFEAVG